MAIKLTKNILFFGILFFWLIVNLLVLFDIQHLYFRAIFFLIFLTIIPGLLIMLMIKIRGISFWEYLVYTIGLSIAFLMFGGLFINWILPLVGIDKPLSLIPLFISLNAFLLVSWIIAYIRNKFFSLEVIIPKLNRLSIVFFIVPIIFPILSVLGAITLNNNGLRYLTLIMLGGIAVYVFSIVAFRNKLKENIYPWAILMISISLLLMYSLRSWHISGWDIHQEYQMFQFTKEYFIWRPANFLGHAYNACLSITILPTILNAFLNINDEYIFKLIFQIIFSFVPVIVFFLSRRYVKSIVAFLASFFFMSQYSFMEQMPALNRQEISILFFALFLIALFEKNFNSSIKKNFLLIIFGFSIIVSHYSTTYVALFLFIFVYFIWLFFRKTENKKIFSKVYQKFNLKGKGIIKREKYYLGGILIFLLFVFNFLWSFQLTETSNNLIYTFNMVTSNIGKIFKLEMISEQARSAFGGMVKTYTIDDVKNYSDNISEEYHTNKTWLNFYSTEKYASFTIEPRYSGDISSTKIKVKIINGLTKISQLSFEIFILVGCIYLLFFLLKKQKIHPEYIIMTLGCIFLIALIIFVPYISIAYNFERLFQQCLVLLSLSAALGMLVVFKFLKNKNTIFILIAMFSIWLFLSNSGFNSNIVGGSPQMNLNNSGEEYDRFYTHESEVKSLEWLSKYYNQKDRIYLDRYAILKTYSFSRINEKNILKDILPSTIDKNAYVYSSYANTINKRTFVSYAENGLMVMSYNFPIEFLNSNKNKIYNNGSSEFFK